MTIVINLIGVILFIIGYCFFLKGQRTILQKNEQQQQYNQKLAEQTNQLANQNLNLSVTIASKQEQIKSIEQQFEQQKKRIDEDLAARKEIFDIKVQQANSAAYAEITQIHTDLNNIRDSAKKQKMEIQAEIDKIKSSLSAGVEARLRDQEKKEKINFYKLFINETDLSDVKVLENLKPTLHKPVILSKLIWTQYFQKQMNELCDRVLGKESICGIYKITNLLTEQAYIGQSVNVADRWKQHCKCGLGIDASATNKLYNAMQKYGVWNFSFELLEQVHQRNLLNEKEKFWIEMYQSNKFGYNGNAGVKNASKN